MDYSKDALCVFCFQKGNRYAGCCSYWCFTQEYATILQVLIRKPRQVVDKDGKPVSYRGRGFIGDI